MKESICHYHKGTTCHGSDTLEQCVADAKPYKENGRVLEKIRDDGRPCYSLIVSSFDHWAKHGTFVAVVTYQQVVTLLPRR